MSGPRRGVDRIHTFKRTPGRTAPIALRIDFASFRPTSCDRHLGKRLGRTRMAPVAAAGEEWYWSYSRSKTRIVRRRLPEYLWNKRERPATNSDRVPSPSQCHCPRTGEFLSLDRRYVAGRSRFHVDGRCYFPLSPRSVRSREGDHTSTGRRFRECARTPWGEAPHVKWL